MGFIHSYEYKTITSTDPQWQGCHWMLRDRSHDWSEPTLTVQPPSGPGRDILSMVATATDWPEGIDRIETHRSLDDIIKTMTVVLTHGVKTIHVPPDVAAAVIDVALQIDADQSAREAELRQVMAKMRAQLAGCHLPPQIFDALAPPYLPDAYTKLCQAIKEVASEAVAIKRETERLASLPVLQGVVLSALSHVNALHPPNQQGGLAKRDAAREAELAGVTLDDDIDFPMKVVKS